MIGTTRSRVSFFMNKFRKLGLISYNEKIEVHNSLLSAVLHGKPEIERMNQQTSRSRASPGLCHREIAVGARRSAFARKQGVRHHTVAKAVAWPGVTSPTLLPYSSVQSKEACNEDDNDDNADDVKDVHCVLRLSYARFNMKSRCLNRKRPGLAVSSVVR
jgi:hypothetical protein